MLRKTLALILVMVLFCPVVVLAENDDSDMTVLYSIVRESIDVELDFRITGNGILC